MKSTGTLKSINIEDGKATLTIIINEHEHIEEYKEFIGKDNLDFDISKHREKRSPNANAYFHVLNSKLADKLRISKTRCKNILIGRYGQPMMTDEYLEAVIESTVPTEKMLENESIHCMPCGSKIEQGHEVIFYKVMRGSSTYDTREMSILIDGTVEECKEQGIETLTPDEINKMMKEWEHK